MEEEYELVPLSPIRRMERRMEKLEKAGTSTDMIKELIEVVKTNQQIVDDVVKINSEMIKRVSELSESVSKAASKMDDFMSRIETTGGNEAPVQQEQNTELQAKIEKLEKKLNSMITSAPLRRPMPVAAARPVTMRRPLAPAI
jgi:uncharacterized coiled-coil protein SlyX